MKSLKIFAACACVLLVCGQVFSQERIKLPDPDTESGITVNRAIHGRRSVRSYSAESLTIAEAGQLLWAAGGATIDGITGATRAYPSAGGIYPLEIYFASGNVEGLRPGLYKYDWKEHSLSEVIGGDIRQALSRAAYGQKMIADAPATIVVTAMYEKTAGRYGERGRTLFVPMDAGHLGQNVHLEAESLGLGTVMVAGFAKEEVSEVLDGTQGEPVYMMPVGRPKK
ncbi:MAG: SagB/ThcOx family dehydrogenase [Candidatus Omnitrophota bacterium]